MKLAALKTDALETLEVDVETNLAAYRFSTPFPLTSEQVLPSPIDVDDNIPELIAKGDRSDLVSAQRLYGWLRFPTERDARDNRIWTWLTHAVFAPYCRKRWPLGTDDNKAASSIRSHWFLEGQGQGAVGRHALARLWWGAHATWSARRRFGFPQLIEDEWAYTTVLLGVQNTNVQIRDRSFSGNPAVLLAALESLRQFGEDGGSIDKAAAWLGRELNVVAKYRSLDALTFDELLGLCRDLLSLHGAPPRQPRRSKL